MNPQRLVSTAALSHPAGYPSFEDNPLGNLASSRHPDGAKFAMADGSVRFLNDKIPSWRVDTLGNPTRVKDGNGTP
jgi:prepilin-type processing-associated H-X9-DG protein